MPTLEGKVAVVTRAGRGIGQGIATRLAADGAAVVINYAANPAEADAAVAAIRASGGQAIAIQADVTKQTDIIRLFAETDRAFGQLDILVNNAGTGALGTLADATEADWDRVFALNAKAPLFVTQEATTRMRDGGRVINIASSITVHPQPGTSVYGASKIVTRLYAEIWATELGDRGITVNAVSPGPTSPGMFDHAPDAMKAGAAAASPFHRLGHPDDVAAVVAFLCRDDARWISGQHILANGGATM